MSRKWMKVMHELGDVIRTGSGMKMAERKRVRGDWQVFAGVVEDGEAEEKSGG